jgi:hypothetical protein
MPTRTQRETATSTTMATTAKKAKTTTTAAAAAAVAAAAAKAKWLPRSPPPQSMSHGDDALSSSSDDDNTDWNDENEADLNSAANRARALQVKIDEESIKIDQLMIARAVCNVNVSLVGNRNFLVHLH